MTDTSKIPAIWYSAMVLRALKDSKESIDALEKLRAIHESKQRNEEATRAASNKIARRNDGARNDCAALLAVGAGLVGGLALRARVGDELFLSRSFMIVKVSGRVE